MSATKRLERAVALQNRMDELQYHLRLTTGGLSRLLDQVDGLAFDINTEIAASKTELLEEQGHHMDPHPTPLSVLRGGR